MDSITIAVFTSVEVQRAAGNSFMKRSSSSLKLDELPSETFDLTTLVQQSNNKSANLLLDENAYRGIVKSRDDLIGKHINLTLLSRMPPSHRRQSHIHLNHYLSSILRF